MRGAEHSTVNFDLRHECALPRRQYRRLCTILVWETFTGTNVASLTDNGFGLDLSDHSQKKAQGIAMCSGALPPAPPTARSRAAGATSEALATDRRGAVA